MLRPHGLPMQDERTALFEVEVFGSNSQVLDTVLNEVFGEQLADPSLDRNHDIVGHPVCVTVCVTVRLGHSIPLANSQFESIPVESLCFRASKSEPGHDGPFGCLSDQAGVYRRR